MAALPMSGWRAPERPGWMQRLIAHGDAVGGASELVSLDPQELLASAMRSTGLEDFADDAAEDDGRWRNHYSLLMGALENESRLHLVGRTLVRTEVLRSLRNRLQLGALWRSRPELLEREIRSPVFIVGSPRTGTSILHELMACDPASRAPAMWEMLHPAKAGKEGRFRDIGHRVTTFWHDVAPEYEAMHANSGDLPNECIFITMNEFLSDHWSGVHDVPSYASYQLREDHRGAYRFHRRVLQTLDAGTAEPMRWVLKAPSHLSTLDALFAVYPDARVVHIHRDPMKTLPSSISLMGTLKWMRCESVDMTKLGQILPIGYESLFRSEIARRADGSLPDDRFVDVLFHDLMTDPLATLDDLYARLGWSLDAPARRRMAEHLARKPRGSRGAHRYSAEGLGLDPEMIRRRFRFYQERFGVPDEA